MSGARRGRVNLPVLLGGLVLVIPLVAILASGFGTDPRALPDTMTGKPAPALRSPPTAVRS